MSDQAIVDPVPDENAPESASAVRPAARRARLRQPQPAPEATSGRKPEWLRIKLAQSEEYWRLKALMREQTLHTVCEEAFCPNLGECWSRGVATFLLLGNICTRSCKFCNVQSGKPLPLDEDEPRRVAESVAKMRLRHVVLTSVDRDDVADGGAHIFAATIREIRLLRPDCTIEVLIPDFKGDPDALKIVLDEQPEILNHNVETVRRLSREVRPQARHERSLAVLRMARAMDAHVLTKSGIMVGLGETWDEILEVMDELRAVDVNILTIGQYLQPSKRHLPIERYYTPAEFETLAREGYERGFRWVESAPLVRSSYHADGQARLIEPRRPRDAAG